MAIVVDPKDVDTMLKYADEENLEAVVVAEVTEEPRLVLTLERKRDRKYPRAFLDTNGAHQETDVKVEIPAKTDNYFDSVKEPEDVKKAWIATCVRSECLLTEGAGRDV